MQRAAVGEGTGTDGRTRAAGKTQGHPSPAWLLPARMKGWRDGEHRRGAGRDVGAGGVVVVVLSTGTQTALRGTNLQPHSS